MIQNKPKHKAFISLWVLEMSMLKFSHLKWLGYGASDTFTLTLVTEMGPHLGFSLCVGREYTQRVHLSDGKNIKSWQLSVSRCFTFSNIKFGLCLLDYIKSCDIWDFVVPT